MDQSDKIIFKKQKQYDTGKDWTNTVFSFKKKDTDEDEKSVPTKLCFKILGKDKCCNLL